MDVEKLKQVQKKQIEIMDVIHEICKKNNLKYYIIGGTALGAVRHGGFIPWDIDIDIAMFRKDYDLFRKICQDSLPLNYQYVDWHYEKNYYPPHALVAIKNTELIQKDDHLNPNLKRYGIFLDVFPLDQAPTDLTLQHNQAKKLSQLTTQKQRKLAIIYQENPWYIKLLKRIISFVYFPVSMRKINIKQETIMTKYNKYECTHWCSMASHYSYEKQCMSKDIYGEPQLVQFEGRYYYAPAHLDDYLKKIFGDYMRIPSKESQQKQIDYFIDAKW